MRTLIALAALLALLALPAAHGADTLPRHLAGAWGTAESLFEGTESQLFVFLAADGAGAIVGSSRAPTKVSEPTPINEATMNDGSTKASVAAPEVMPRAIVGFPIRARLAGDALTLQVVYPAAAKAPPQAKMPVFACQHDAAAITLTCLGPDGIARTLQFRGNAIPAEAEQAMGLARQQ